MKKVIDVAVSYGWNRVAYNMTRALALQGLKVAVGDMSGVAMAKASRFNSASFKYPSFYKQPQSFINEVESVFLRLKPKVYLPSHEETFIVARHIDRFQKMGVKVPVADFETLRLLHRKDLLTKKAEGFGIPVPKTFKLKSRSELKDIWGAVSSNGKAVVKMLNTNSSKGVFYATSYNELEVICDRLTGQWSLSPEYYPLVQEYVEGEGYGVSMLFNKGKLRAKFTHRRMREKLMTGGTSTVRISTENACLESYAEDLLSRLEFHGVAMVEFKYNEAEKRGWLIEVNPRYWGSLALAIHSGVNFPFLAYKMALNGDVDPVVEYKKGIICRWILGDVIAAVDAFRSKKRLSPIKAIGQQDIKFDDFYLDDPLPFFVQAAYYAKKLITGFNFNPTDDALLDVDHL